jgi:hypothetical protein
MEKPKAVLVGGKAFNISEEFHKRFNIVRHFDQDAHRISAVQGIAIILILRDFVSHNMIERVKAMFPRTPIVAAHKGWSHMYTELERRRLLPPQGE